MAVALENVVKQLEDSGIVAPGKLKEFIPPKASPKDGEELLRELFKQNLVTKFQAQQFALGKAKTLILGEYTILDKIGAGGMGQVFKALHRRMDRTVAIKMLPPAMMKDAAAIARFEREVKAAAKLRHPNIVAADDAGQANGVHFLVMEYVEGSDLSALVKKHGPLQRSKALNYILQAARGLEFAHKKGVVHRDIKPANLLLDSEGTVKILDMGLARIEAGGDQATQAELTGTGAVMGTVDYMAPEQAISTKGVDSRADIYSLGCTLYYLLAGKCTYDGETLMAKLLAHREAPIPSLAEVQEGVPAEVQAIFGKMVAKKVEDRYQTMTEVIVDLEKAITGPSSPSNLKPPAETSDTGLTKFFKELPAPSTQRGKPVSTKQVAAPVVAAPKKANPKLAVYGSIVGGVLSLIGIPLVLYLAFSGGDKPPRRPNPNVATPDSLTIGPLQDYALRFSGQQSGVTIPTLLSDTIQSVTVEAYISTGNAAGTAWIVGWPNSNVALNTYGGKDFRLAFPPKHNTISVRSPQGQRRHVAGVIDGQEARLYFDGKLTGNVDIVANSAISRATALMIGREGSGSNSLFDGVIDEVRVSRGVRYKSDFVPQPRFKPDSDTLALYHCDEGTGEVLHDSSGNGHDGKIVGAKWVRADGSPVNSAPSADAVDLLAQIDPQRDSIQTKWKREGTVLVSASARYSRLEVPYRMPQEYVLEAIVEPTQVSADGFNFILPFAGRQVMLGVDGHDMHLSGLVNVDGNNRLTKGSETAKTLVLFQKGQQSRIRIEVRKGRIWATCNGIEILDWRGDPNRLSLDPPWFLRDKNAAGLGAWEDVYRVHKLTLLPLTEGPTPLHAVAPFDAAQAKAHQQAWAKHFGTDVVNPNSIGIQMTLIPPGEFLMGSSDADIALALKIAEETKLDEYGVQRIQEERPQHRVRITQPFRLAAHEVTIGQFAKFVEQTKYKTRAEEFGGNSSAVKPEEVRPENLRLMWRTPGHAVTDDSPVTQVSWNDAVAFCNWLSGQEQLTPCYQRDADTWTLLPKANGYRLPTEAEWEYACRSGTATQYSFGDDWQELDKYGWTNKKAGGRPHSVGSLPPNPFGLYDMHGNVWEWCQDWYDGEWYEKSPSDDPFGPSRALNRVNRGGSWSFIPASSRSSSRMSSTPSDRNFNRGFRPALSSVGAPSSTASVTPQPTVPAASSSTLFMHDPAFPQWVKDVQAKPAEEQVQAVSKKLVELNPGFDGVVTGFGEKGRPKIENGAVTALGFNTDSVIDVSPVRALVELRDLNCGGVRSNLFDLSPLHGMKLANVICSNTQVSDLTPLRQTSLITLICNGTQIVDVSPLDGCRSLRTLNLRKTKVTSVSVAALQKALPNCKIEWDDPAKATTPQPAASGSK